MLKNISDGIFHSSSEKKRICLGKVETNTIFTFLCIVRNLSQSFAAEGIDNNNKNNNTTSKSNEKKAETVQKAILNAHSAESCFTTDIPRRKFQLLQRHFRTTNLKHANKNNKNPHTHTRTHIFYLTQNKIKRRKRNDRKKKKKRTQNHR